MKARQIQTRKSISTRRQRIQALPAAPSAGPQPTHSADPAPKLIRWVSVTPEVKRSMEAIASAAGATTSQVLQMAILKGLPALESSLFKVQQTDEWAAGAALKSSVDQAQPGQGPDAEASHADQVDNAQIEYAVAEAIEHSADLVPLNAQRFLGGLLLLAGDQPAVEQLREQCVLSKGDPDSLRAHLARAGLIRLRRVGTLTWRLNCL